MNEMSCVIGWLFFAKSMTNWRIVAEKEDRSRLMSADGYYGIRSDGLKNDCRPKPSGIVEKGPEDCYDKHRCDETVSAGGMQKEAGL